MPWKLLPPGKRGPYWYFRGTDASGRFEVSTGKANRQDAAKWAEEYLLLRARSRVPGTGETVGFSDAARFYKAFRNLSRADERLIDAVAAYFHDNTDCRALTHAHLVAAANALKPGRTDATKNRKVIKPAAAVLHYAAEPSQRWCDYQRIRGFRESKISNREPASDATMAKLFAHVEEPPEKIAPQWHGVDHNIAYKRLLLAMLYELGLRITDYLRIRWEGQIDLQAGLLRGVRVAKTDRVVTLTLSSVIVTMLANLPDREKTGWLFPWRTRRGVYAWLDRVQERAGVEYTPHQSRHAMATAAGLQRIPDAEAAKLGAWADPRSLHRYQHVAPEPIPGRDAGFLTTKKARNSA